MHASWLARAICFCLIPLALPSCGRVGPASDADIEAIAHDAAVDALGGRISDLESRVEEAESAAEQAKREADSARSEAQQAQSEVDHLESEYEGHSHY